jgi:hypothetical protein
MISERSSTGRRVMGCGVVGASEVLRSDDDLLRLCVAAGVCSNDILRKNIG